MEKQAKYVYGIVNIKDVDITIKGIDQENVYPIPHSDISAIVSDTLFVELDPIDENLLAHENVIQHVMFNLGHTVAPMRFSTILKTKGDVEKLLEAGYTIFKNNLQKISGKAEFGLKAFFDHNKIQEGDIIKKSHDVALDIFNSLKSISLDNHLKDQSTDDMIVNGAFLLSKDAKKTFHNKILELDEKYGNFVIFRPSGPSAPYHFVKMPEK